MPIAVLFAVILVVELVIIATTHVIVNRKYYSIKDSSLRLNQIFFLGCYILITGTMLQAVSRAIAVSNKTRANICQTIWAWFIPIGYTLIFGTVGVCTWRLYQIFKHYLDPGCFLSNTVLAVFVLILLVIDVVVGTIWTALDSFYIENRLEININGGRRK